MLFVFFFFLSFILLTSFFSFIFFFLFVFSTFSSSFSSPCTFVCYNHRRIVTNIPDLKNTASPSHSSLTPKPPMQEKTREDSRECERLKELLGQRTGEYIEEVLAPHFGGMLTFVRETDHLIANNNTEALKDYESECRSVRSEVGEMVFVMASPLRPLVYFWLVVVWPSHRPFRQRRVTLQLQRQDQTPQVISQTVFPELVQNPCHLFASGVFK